MIFFLPHSRNTSRELHTSNMATVYNSWFVLWLVDIALPCDTLLRNTEFWRRLQAGFSQSLVSQLAFRGPSTVRQKAGKCFMCVGLWPSLLSASHSGVCFWRRVKFLLW